METVKFFFKYGVMALVFALVSCSSDGADGAIGPQGVAGTTGSQGPTGAQGIQGIQGEQGNANVRTFTYDVSTETGGNIDVTIPEFTQTVIDNDAILWYIRIGNLSYSIPGAIDSADYVVRVYSRTNTARISFHEWDGTVHSIAAGDIDEIKMIIIASTTPETTKTSIITVEEELAVAGIDSNDYEAVLAYYTN